MRFFLFMLATCYPYDDIPRDLTLYEEKCYYICVNKPVCKILLNLQLIDEKEFRYHFTALGMLRQDIRSVWIRAESLKNAPYTFSSEEEEEMWGIKNEFIKETALVRNREFQRFCNLRVIFYGETDHRGKYWEDLSKENTRLQCIYDSLSDATSPYYYLTSRRMGLESLKELLGEDNFNNRRLPYFIPMVGYAE